MRLGGPSKLLGLGVNSWVSGFLTPQPPVTNVQRTTITLGAAELTHTSGNLTVRNSAYVRLRYLDHSTNGGGADLGAVETARVSLNIVDAKTVTVTATRAAQNGVIVVVVSVEVSDLNPRFVKSIQRGTGGSSPGAGTDTTITAVNVNKSELDKLGQVGADASGAAAFSRIALKNSTTINAIAETGLTYGWQVIEGR